GSPRLWSPESPHLYGVKAELLDGETVVDTLHTYFGLREVAIAPLHEGGPKYLTLNSLPIYLRGALDQSFNPAGVYTFLSDEAMIQDLELAKQAGFNFLRIHIKPEDPRFLYHADRLGMLIMYDLPNTGYNGYGEVGNARWEWTFRRCVERDFNHPCIFSWVLFNETWGLGGNAYRDATDRHEWVKSMYRLAKQLDDTRPIEDNSPCLYDHVLTDINSWHFYINDYEKAREHVANVVAQTYSGSEFNYVGGNKQGDGPLMNSEYGGIGASMGDLDVSWCLKFLTDLLRRQEKVCGYIYTELQDIEWEYNGIYNYDRSPKQWGYNVADLQGPVYLGFDCPPMQTVAPGVEVRLPMFINRACYHDDIDELTYRVRGLNSLGEEFTLVPITAVPVDLTVPEPVVAFELPPLTVPDDQCVLRVECRLGTEAGNFTYFEVRSARLPVSERLSDGRLVLRKLAGETEVSSAWHEAEVERGVVDYEQHLMGGIESGHFDYRFTLPEDCNLTTAKSLTLVFEASSKRHGAPQTSDDKWPSELHTCLNGHEVDVRILPDQPADSRGALSHFHNLRGRYGELIRIEVPGAVLKQLGDTRDLLLSLDVPRSAVNHRGLILYSSRAGRYPCDVTAVIRP
ncbi:MAG: glycoside hydrolase family 2 TIM barrel-domain containing protein, partial [Armatimonadia bacterium]